MPTVQTLHLLNLFPQKLMVLFGVHLIVIFDLIVAESARPELTADGALLLAPPPVVLAPELGV